MKICLGPFTLDLDTRQLTRGRREIHLASKAFELGRDPDVEVRLDSSTPSRATRRDS